MLLERHMAHGVRVDPDCEADPRRRRFWPNAEGSAYVIVGPPRGSFSGSSGLSLKQYVGGRTPFRLGPRRTMVGDERALLVNEGEDYAFAAGPDLINFTVFLEPSELSAAWRTAAEDDAALLDDPEPGPTPGFVSMGVSLGWEAQLLRARVMGARARGVLDTALVDEALLSLTVEMARAQIAARRDLARIARKRRSTREEVYRRLRRARDLIDEDPAADLTVGVLAHTACMSKHHFMRCFRQAFGVSPHQHVLARRMAEAKRLLSTGRHGVGEVGRLCGYGDIAVFSNAFRDHTGAPPSRWRAG
ncbi:MAG: AraC family transcriptional regulator [Phenylobacterium sp.]